LEGVNVRNVAGIRPRGGVDREEGNFVPHYELFETRQESAFSEIEELAFSELALGTLAGRENRIYAA
jgi:hypothetical protein